MKTELPRFFDFEKAGTRSIVNMIRLLEDFPQIFHEKMSKEKIVDFDLFQFVETVLRSPIVNYYSHEKCSVDRLILKVEQDILKNELTKKLIYKCFLPLEKESISKTNIMNKMFLGITILYGTDLICSMSNREGNGNFVNLKDRDGLSEIPGVEFSFKKNDLENEDEWLAIQDKWEETLGYYISDLEISYDITTGELNMEATLDD
ncbi:MAG: hypothetical protein PHP08_02915 [Candidatus Dojkabacteria bacterium]|nr:hypothetical protein [Candidatus Dojkabacteria bacterium]